MKFVFKLLKIKGWKKKTWKWARTSKEHKHTKQKHIARKISTKEEKNQVRTQAKCNENWKNYSFVGLNDAMRTERRRKVFFSFFPFRSFTNCILFHFNIMIAFSYLSSSSLLVLFSLFHLIFRLVLFFLSSHIH